MYAREPQVFPATLHRDVIASPPPPRYPRSPGVYLEWIEACKGNGTAGSSFPDHSGPLTEVVLLGNLAVWAEKKVEWDAKTLTPKNTPEVKTIVRREYRKGWTL